jgi:hypothetical protein
VGSVAAAVARRRGEIAGGRGIGAISPRRFETELADGGGGYAVGVTP